VDQFVILVIIGLISLVNWLIQRSAEQREKKRLERKALDGDDAEEVQADVFTAPRPVAENPGAEMRKLMEALGLPMEEPPPVLEPEPQRTFVEKAPPQLPAPSPVRTYRQPFSNPATARLARARPAVTTTSAPHPLAALLNNPSQLRQAIVLREVLGPCKSLQQH